MIVIQLLCRCAIGLRSFRIFLQISAEFTPALLLKYGSFFSFIQIDDILSRETRFKIRGNLTSAHIDRQIGAILEHIRSHFFDRGRDLDSLQIRAVAEHAKPAGDHQPRLIEIHRFNE